MKWITQKLSRCYLQSSHNPVYNLRFNKRLITLNINDNIIFILKFLECFIATFSTWKLIKQKLVRKKNSLQKKYSHCNKRILYHFGKILMSLSHQLQTLDSNPQSFRHPLPQLVQEEALYGKLQLTRDEPNYWRPIKWRMHISVGHPLNC